VTNAEQIAVNLRKLHVLDTDVSHIICLLNDILSSFCTEQDKQELGY